MGIGDVHGYVRIDKDPQTYVEPECNLSYFVSMLHGMEQLPTIDGYDYKKNLILITYLEFIKRTIPLNIEHNMDVLVRYMLNIPA